MSELDLVIKRELREIPESEWKDWLSEGKVIAEMIGKSGLQEKTIAIETGIDSAIISKAKTGQARFSEKNMNDFMDACGSEAWLQYWIIKRGYDPRSLRRFETDVEQENRLLREENERLKRDREVEMRLFRELRAA